MPIVKRRGRGPRRDGSGPNPDCPMKKAVQRVSEGDDAINVARSLLGEAFGTFAKARTHGPFDKVQNPKRYPYETHQKWAKAKSASANRFKPSNTEDDLRTAAGKHKDAAMTHKDAFRQATQEGKTGEAEHHAKQYKNHIRRYNEYAKRHDAIHVARSLLGEARKVDPLAAHREAYTRAEFAKSAASLRPLIAKIVGTMGYKVKSVGLDKHSNHVIASLQSREGSTGRLEITALKNLRYAAVFSLTRPRGPDMRDKAVRVGGGLGVMAMLMPDVSATNDGDDFESVVVGAIRATENKLKR